MENASHSGHVETLALDRAGLHHLGDRQPIGLEPGFRLPDFHVLRVYPVERSIELGRGRLPEGLGTLRDHRHEPNPLQPGEGRQILGLGHGEQQVSADLLDPKFEELPRYG